MKLSLHWLFDHINADWKSVDVQKLVAEFNKKTAEIEGFYQVNTNLSLLSFASIIAIEQNYVVVSSSEWQEEFQLPVRSDLGQWDHLNTTTHYLIKKENGVVSWARSIDLGAHKDYLLPAFTIQNSDAAGAWKKSFQEQDWIIEIDNKSINHRPDLWCHRGIAREVVALLNKDLKPLDTFLTQHTVTEYAESQSKPEKGSFKIMIDDPALCRRFAGLNCVDVQNLPSSLTLASRLVRLDQKIIDTIVDITNYVMLDIGQPMHAFDAAKIEGGTIHVRAAKDKEKITLLDGETVALSPQDLVVADSSKSLAVAGVMGGQSSAVLSQTKSLFLESANFDPAMIRKTAAHIKRRTEAAVRFEKNLDPHGNVTGILRFLALAQKVNLLCKPVGSIHSLGKLAAAPVIAIEQSFIDACLGVALSVDTIKALLTKLDFGVRYDDGMYKVTVPTFRATKDVALPEDIVEEISRFYGYDNLPTQLPRRFMMPFSMHAINRVRRIKHYMADNAQMREVYNYALHDESFLRLINWSPENAISVLGPVSENWRLLVTTLIPGLLKNVYDNSAESEQLRFFEWARVWHTNLDTPKEQKLLSGIIVNSGQKNIDFYDAKALITGLFDALHIPVSWEQVATSQYPWFEPYQTATIKFEEKNIGTFGKLRSSFLHNIVSGEGYAFELDGNFLLSYKEERKPFAMPSKYPLVERDISMLIKDSVTVQQITSIIEKADPRIISVELRDMFKKAEWHDQRSLTFRFVVSDREKTLSKEETEEIGQRAISELIKHGAVIR
ncbi:MAG: phenylalanine--tRNA ligase subunit beta [Candidatus Dependentiae bacterium]|nr:phenylalanine--tRNA ligase subunit beta [Candidatus Dependentiae bacterium]